MEQIIPMREVVVVSGQGNLKRIKTDATTWGQLKGVLSHNGISNLSDLKAVEGNSKVTYEDEGALLPAEDFKLFLFPNKKMKSGINIEGKTFGELRQICKTLTGFAPNGKQACIDAINAHSNTSTKTCEKKVISKKEEIVPKSVVAAKESDMFKTKYNNLVGKLKSILDNEQIVSEPKKATVSDTDILNEYNRMK